MVTMLSDGRGQSTLKGKEVDAEWEGLIRKAAERSGSTVAAFVVHHTREAAQAILKNEPVGPVALPIRLEDLATGLEAKIAALAEDQRQLGAAQEERLARIERTARRGRWRR